MAEGNSAVRSQEGQESGCNSNKLVKNTERRNDEKSMDKRIAVTIDHKALCCYFCLNPLEPSMASKCKVCTGGHIACFSCCKIKLIDDKCPTCYFPVSNTCNAFISVLKSIKVCCCYARFGCSCEGPYSFIDRHERACDYEPISCPVNGCTFKCATMQLSWHTIVEHSSTPHKYFSYGEWFNVSPLKDCPFHVLIETTDRKHSPAFLLLNGDNLPSGRCLSIFCLRPPRDIYSQWFQYEIKVICRDDELYYKSNEMDCGKWDGKYPSTKFLYASYGFRHLEIRLSCYSYEEDEDEDEDE